MKTIAECKGLNKSENNTSRRGSWSSIEKVNRIEVCTGECLSVFLSRVIRDSSAHERIVSPTLIRRLYGLRHVETYTWSARDQGIKY